MRLGLLLFAFLLSGCVSSQVQGDNLDEIAADYVQMTLEIGEREPGYVDAYYGPPEWAAAAKSAPRSVEDLAEAAAALTARTEAIDPAGLEPTEVRRRAFLLAQLTAARTRLRMMQGEELSFADEARGLFAVVPDLKPLSAYDPVLARIDTLVPGEGPLAERVDAFQNRLAVPKDRLDAVMRAAIAECRRRTVRHIPLPDNESFRLEFVTDKSWSGYNYYQGDAASLIQINADLPVRISRAVDLGCHEGYPGHHVLNLLLEQKLTKGRGWIEFSIYPLYSPQSLIAEGSANYGTDLAFPGEERLQFERATLYPLARLPVAEAAAYDALLHAMKELTGARMTIARDYLDGRIDRAEAIRLFQKYQLVSEARAKQGVDFFDQYRSYVINYGWGEQMVRERIEREPAERRWAVMEQLLSEPTLPADLTTR